MNTYLTDNRSKPTFLLPSISFSSITWRLLHLAPVDSEVSCQRARDWSSTHAQLLKLAGKPHLRKLFYISRE